MTEITKVKGYKTLKFGTKSVLIKKKPEVIDRKLTLKIIDSKRFLIKNNHYASVLAEFKKQVNND